MFRIIPLTLAAVFCSAPVLAQQTGEAPSSFHWADFDQDGYADALVVAPDGRARLFRNQGDGSLADVTEPAGISDLAGIRLALWEDLDGDGRPDLFLAGHETTHVFRNLGEGLFEDASFGSGLAAGDAVLHAGKVDYDRDGRIDLHLRTATANLLFRNAGEGTFERVELGAPLVPTDVSMATFPTAPAEARRPDDATKPEKVRETSGRRLVPVLDREAPTGGGIETAGLPPGGSISSTPLPWCAKALQDPVSGACLYASTVPVLGRLCPLSVDFFIEAGTGRVGLGTTAPLERLDVVGNALFRGSTVGAVVKGDSLAIITTRGYLGIQGTPDFDGVLTADWSGFEIGAAGISTGGSATDNYGLMGHSNGAGVRGESSLDPLNDFGELGGVGVGVRASGTALAGEFLGDVDVSGALDVGGTTDLGETYIRNADLHLENDTGGETIRLDPEAGTGGLFYLFNDFGAISLLADSDYAGSGAGRVYVRNKAGATRVDIDGGFSNTDAGSILLDAADGSPTIYIDAEAENSGGAISVRNDLNEETVRLVGDYGDSGAIRLYDRSGSRFQETASLRASNGFNAAELEMQTTSGTEVMSLSGSDGGGGALSLYEPDGSIALLALGFQNTLFMYDDAGTLTISFDGRTGSKSAVAATSQGQRLLYAMESPEVWVEDFGRGQLVNGQARIDLDPLFLETVTIDERHPMHVHVTPTAPSLGMWVEEGSGWFVVHELGDGRGSATFNWRVTAKREGLENARLEPAPEPPVPVPAPNVAPQDGVDRHAEVAADELG